MMRGNRLRLFRKIVITLLAVVTVLYLVSGFGITEFRTVEAITFGLFSKNLSFKIHNILLIPALIILAVHLYLTFRYRPRVKAHSSKEKDM